MTKSRKNLQRRLRKIRARIKKLNVKDSLLDLTPFCEPEKKTFLVSEEDIARRVWLQLANSILNGTKVPPQTYNFKKLPWPSKPGEIIGLRSDFLIVDDPNLLNYPLTDAEDSLSLLNKETEDK